MQAFVSIAECARFLNTAPRNVHAACTGKNLSVDGHKVRYKEQWRKQAAAPFSPGHTRVTLEAGKTRRGVKVPVELLDDSGTVRRRFKSERACARHLRSTSASVQKAMLGKKERLKGYTLRHANKPQRPITLCVEAEKRAEARAKVVAVLSHNAAFRIGFGWPL